MAERISTAPISPGNRIGTRRLAESPVEAIRESPKQASAGVRRAEAPQSPGLHGETKTPHKK